MDEVKESSICKSQENVITIEDFSKINNVVSNLQDMAEALNCHSYHKSSSLLLRIKEQAVQAKYDKHGNIETLTGIS